MKKIYKFSEKSELPKFILPVKINWLIFSGVSGEGRRGSETFAQNRAGPMSSSSRTSPFDFTLADVPPVHTSHSEFL